jgi:hypothetical protein
MGFQWMRILAPRADSNSIRYSSTLARVAPISSTNFAAVLFRRVAETLGRSTHVFFEASPRECATRYLPWQRANFVADCHTDCGSFVRGGWLERNCSSSAWSSAIESGTGGVRLDMISRVRRPMNLSVCAGRKSCTLAESTRGIVHPRRKV